MDAVPAKTYPADATVRLRTALVPYAVRRIRELIEQGVLAEVDGKIVVRRKP